MKRLLLLSFIFCSLSVLVSAQSFDLTFDDSVVVFDCVPGADFDIINHGFVTDLSGSSNDLYWVRNEIYLPDGWGSAICDYERCYFQTVGERSLDLTGNQMSTFDLHLYNNNVQTGDSAVIEICVFEDGDTTTMQCATITFVCDASSTADEPVVEQQLVLSPNPATNYFQIENKDQVGRVEVYNIIGAKLKAFDTRETAVYQVDDLPSGIYLVRLYDKDDSSVLSTLRLKKR